MPPAKPKAKTLLFKEIAEKFDGEWVIVADPKLDKHNRVKSGRIIAHSPDRDQAYRQARQKKDAFKSFATLCFKKLDSEQAIIL